jgi:S1-C subfamily serine protease
LALLGVVALSACDSDDPNEALDPDQSTVGVLATGCGPSPSAGSGVVLGQPGHVVTVAHAVAGATSIVVVDAAGTEWPAQLTAIDVAADLAVLTIEDFVAPSLRTGEVQLGAATTQAWSPRDGIISRSVGVTKRLAITIDDIYGESSVRRSGLEIDGDIEVGDSGGPVVAPDGSVIGIVYARSRSRASTAFATDASEIDRVLATIGSTPVDSGRCV